MLINLRSRAVPVISRLLGRAGLGASFTDQIVETVEVAAAERIYSPGIVSLPSESSRATGTMAHTTLEAIRGLEKEGDFPHGATLAHRVQGAILADGCVYASTSHRVVTPQVQRRKLLPRQASCHDEAQLCSDISSELYFGHWLLDGLCTERLAIERRLTGVVFDGTPSTHKQAYREICTVSSTRIDYAFVDRLWLIDDRGLNSARMTRWLALRASVRAMAEQAQGPRLVYLARSGGAINRNLVNGKEVERMLDRLGFVTIDPMLFDTMSLAKLLSQARIVVSVEGSHQSHALMAMPTGGALVTIQPADRFLHSYLFFANAAGIRCAFVVAERLSGDYQLSVDRLRQTLNLIG